MFQSSPAGRSAVAVSRLLQDALQWRSPVSRTGHQAIFTQDGATFALRI